MIPALLLACVLAAPGDLWRVTAYCPCQRCCGGAKGSGNGITASGKSVTANGGKFCAAPRSIPFGTMLRIPGYHGGQAVPVLDRGGAIKGRRLDVFFLTHKEALAWGRQRLRVARKDRHDGRSC